MCGITGGWTLSQFRQLSEKLPAMTTALAHRGPDAFGYWLDDAYGLAFGHRRLAILGLGEEGAQPMVSESGRYRLVYNGEIYNHQALRDELAKAGIKTAWRGQSDTETILACFEHHGIENAVQRCVGMFAMAVWDEQNRELTLIRDRIGEKPLYYGFTEGTLVFASELHAIRRFAPQALEYNTDAFALFLRYGYIPAPYSAYKAIAKLDAGCMLTVTTDDIRRAELPQAKRYWSPESFLPNNGSASLSETECVDELDRLLEQSVKSQMLSEVPLGAFLSGGIDSSTVVALMQKNSMQAVKTFTIGFGDKAFNEAEYAKAVAQHLGTEHTELYVSDADALAVVPMLAGIYDEPFSDSSQIPTYLISKLARSKVTVSLSGDGGDELFLGYGRYPLLVNYWKLLGGLPLALRAVVSNCLKCLPMRHWDTFFRLAKPLLNKTPYAQANGWRLYRIANMLTLDSPEACYLEMMSHWSSDETLIKGAAILPHELMRGFDGKAQGLMKKAALRDIGSYLPDDILVKVDRAAMANSLETRVPLLDHRVAEFALSLPQSMHYRHGQSKWLLRQVLFKHVPRALMERPKMGFGVPLAEWLRGPLKPWADDLLSHASLARIEMLNPVPIIDLWQRHSRRETDGHYPLWNVLMLIEWLNANIEKQASE